MRTTRPIHICIIVGTLLLIVGILYSVGVQMGIISNRERYLRTACDYEVKTMRAIAVGLETRFMKKKEYPPGKLYWGPFNYNLAKEIDENWGIMIDPLNRDGNPKNWRTGPTADELRGEPIRVRGSDYQYYTDGKSFWALIARGPDGVLNITTTALHRVGNSKLMVDGGKHETWSPALVDGTYDPSNGASSSGDIWRVIE